MTEGYWPRWLRRGDSRGFYDTFARRSDARTGARLTLDEMRLVSIVPDDERAHNDAVLAAMSAVPEDASLWDSHEWQARLIGGHRLRCAAGELDGVEFYNTEVGAVGLDCVAPGDGIYAFYQGKLAYMQDWAEYANGESGPPCEG